ncbi:Uncharacterised protein [Pseudomonas aeruginosa]|nr:Uncharacterised protein [Pseudomonas aeruginosa]
MPRRTSSKCRCRVGGSCSRRPCRISSAASTALARLAWPASSLAPGEGTQAGGDAAHAVDQFIDGGEVGAGGLQFAALEEAHGVAGQRTQRRQWLVEFRGRCWWTSARSPPACRPGPVRPGPCAGCPRPAGARGSRRSGVRCWPAGRRCVSAIFTSSSPLAVAAPRARRGGWRVPCAARSRRSAGRPGGRNRWRPACHCAPRRGAGLPAGLSRVRFPRRVIQRAGLRQVGDRFARAGAAHRRGN